MIALFADSREAVLRRESSRKSVRESITRSQAFVVRKNLKPQENVNIINCAQKSLAVLSGIFIIIWTIIRGRK